MKPVMQTIFAPPDGNCFAACVASILELPLEDVPNDHDCLWLGRFRDWLNTRGLDVIPILPADGEDAWLPRGYSILSGRSPRGDWLHSVVALDGQMVHDPHPAGGGVLTVHDHMLFIALDPARARKGERDDITL